MTSSTPIDPQTEPTRRDGVSRRALVGGAAGLLAALLPRTGGFDWARAQEAGLDLGPKTPFSFDALKTLAEDAARRPYRGAAIENERILESIDYDAYQQIRFRRAASLDIGGEMRTPVQMFHLGRYFKEPVRLHTVDSDSAREVRYSARLFETPAGHAARKLPPTAGFAGFRVMGPSLETDWLAFLGASYFRTSGPFNQYGISARGLAVDTGLSTPEEFPRFTAFYLEGGKRGATAITVYALLDSKRVTGAYRMEFERLTDTRDVHRIEVRIEANLYARGDIGRLGIAPFSSMFWYGETRRSQAADWRPEIHDSDGLAIQTGSGERIWRPLINPPRVMTNAFLDRDPKGFGLLQRDRDFVHYLDDGVFYERRPSVWVEPLEPWGEGAVHLLEIPTADETSDNVALYWCPAAPFRKGEQRRYSYRLTWLDDIPFPDSLGRSTATWTGLGGRPGLKRPEGVKKFVIDFQGPVFRGLGRNDGVEIAVTASRGAISNSYTHPVVDQRERWRAFFDLEASGADPVDLRAYLKRGPQALTETWLYQYFPEQA